MITFARQVLVLFSKDLLVEARTKDALMAMVVFALLVLVTFNFALDLRGELVSIVGPGVLWVTVIFASVLGLGRTFASEREQGTLDGLLAAPLAPGALFCAKLLTNVVFVGAVQLVTVPVFAVLFGVSISPLPVLLILFLGTLGLAAVGTLFAAVSSQTRAREVMLPVLMLPVAVPVVIGVVQALGRTMGNEAARDMPWLNLLIAFDAIYVAVGAAVFDYALEE